ncbi:hypothetical protein NDU88_007758 [Pleurodeles waltl]|uniref:Uncharacterized protein n=1 Tax=Pleurodeles waltl TaxID=8319 RepID=A0AAV7NTZ4_PLEWA|nr:hypothetical protein NDU88_007758 [Pleurodeles waltl]
MRGFEEEPGFWDRTLVLVLASVKSDAAGPEPPAIEFGAMTEDILLVRSGGRKGYRPTETDLQSADQGRRREPFSKAPPRLHTDKPQYTKPSPAALSPQGARCPPALAVRNRAARPQGIRIFQKRQQNIQTAPWTEPGEKRGKVEAALHIEAAA